MSRLTLALQQELKKEQDSSSSLLELARVFRQQADLMLWQADRLDHMATADVDDDKKTNTSLVNPEEAFFPGPSSGETSSTRWARQNTVALVNESSQLMLEVQTMMDGIEGRLLPWKETTYGNTILPTQRKRSGFQVFVKEHFFTLQQGLPSKQGLAGQVTKEASRLWNSMSRTEKQEYEEKAAPTARGAVKTEDDAPPDELKQETT